MKGIELEHPKIVSQTGTKRKDKEFRTLLQDQLTFRWLGTGVPQEFLYHIEQCSNISSGTRNLFGAVAPLSSSWKSWGRLAPSARNGPAKTLNNYTPQEVSALHSLRQTMSVKGWRELHPPASKTWTILAFCMFKRVFTLSK